MSPEDFIPDMRFVRFYRFWLRLRNHWWMLLTWLRLKEDLTGDFAPPAWGPEPIHEFWPHVVTNYSTGKTSEICKRCGGGKKNKVHTGTK
jgi:hypothetical protein